MFSSHLHGLGNTLRNKHLLSRVRECREYRCDSGGKGEAAGRKNLRANSNRRGVPPPREIASMYRRDLLTYFATQKGKIL